MSLQLTRLRIEHLRQFRQPFELGPLALGLNIFSGPNEAGKSTLVRAIRAAFFERYRSKAVEDLRPWGDAGAMPQVEIDFVLQNQAGHLLKSFLSSKARCSLSWGGTQLDGAEAEDRLAQLFGYGFASKGASRPEHWGIPGLLWVEQGTGQELADAAAHARDHIHSALQDQVSQATAGAVAATGADELLSQFQAQRDDLLTATGKPRASYLDAIQQVEQLQQQIAELDELINRYQQQVDQLATLRHEHQQDEHARPWEAMRARLTEAQQAEQRLQLSAQQLAEAQTAAQRLNQQHQLLLNQIQSFEQLQQSLAQRQQAAQQAAETLLQADQACVLAQQQADQAHQQAQRARGELSRSRQHATRLTLQKQWQEAQEAAMRYEQALHDASEKQAQLDQLKAQAAACVLSRNDLEALRRLERQLQDLNLQRQAVSTRLQFALQGTQGIELHGARGVESLTGQGERLLAEAVTLQLPGLGQLTITPGGQDLNALARDHAQVQSDLLARLQSLGLADVAQAEARLLQHQELVGQVSVAQQMLAHLAPKGLDPLKQAWAQAQGQMQLTHAALAQLPGSGDVNGAVQAVLPLSAAEAAQQAADQLEVSTRQVLAQAQQSKARAEVQVQSTQRELERAQGELNSPERLSQHQQAQQQLLALEQDRRVQTVLVQELTRQREESRPDIVRQDIDRLTRSMAQLEQAHQQRHTRIQVLENELQLAGAQGLEEQRQLRSGELDRAQRRVIELRRRAQALDLLCAKFQGKRQAALARLQAPLQKHLQHYLQLLFPHAGVEVGEQLTPDTLVRRSAAGATESSQFAALSFGAREQLALISRFAYADLLREAGRPTLLILDDALVHSDAQRLSAMKRVIFDAAQRHQVLLFTCHPENWRDMGVPIQSLQR